MIKKGDSIMNMKSGYVEYTMSKTMAQELLKSRKAEEKKMKPNDYLCKVINEQFGLMGTCSIVHQI